MSSMKMLSDMGPRLSQDYLNTNRKDFGIGALLDELDIRNEGERADFQHYLKDFMRFDPKTKTGYHEHELAELNDSYMRCYAEQFLDEGIFKKQKWPIGKTYFPPIPLKNSEHTSPHHKKWSYDQHRTGIIDVVTQIMIIQRNSIDICAKRARKQDSTKAGTRHPNGQQSDDDYAPRSSQSLKRPRKQNDAPISAQPGTARMDAFVPICFDPETIIRSKSSATRAAAPTPSKDTSQCPTKLSSVQAAPGVVHINGLDAGSNNSNVQLQTQGTYNTLIREGPPRDLIEVENDSAVGTIDQQRGTSQGDARLGLNEIAGVRAARDPSVRALDISQDYDDSGILNTSHSSPNPSNQSSGIISTSQAPQQESQPTPKLDLRPDLALLYKNAMTWTEDPVNNDPKPQRDAAVLTSMSQHDAATQTLAQAGAMTVPKMTDLITAGTSQAHRYLLHIYGELQFDARSTEGPDAERLTAQADIILSVAVGFKKALKEPTFAIGANGELQYVPAPVL